MKDVCPVCCHRVERTNPVTKVCRDCGMFGTVACGCDHRETTWVTAVEALCARSQQA